MSTAWLDSGARVFSVHDVYGKVIAQWPVEARPAETTTCASVYLDAQVVGELRVDLPENTFIKAQLTMQASFVTRLLTAEMDITAMAGEIIELQDQLLDFYRLNESMRGLLDIPQTMATLAVEAERLFKTDGTFVVFQAGPQEDMLIVQHPPHRFHEEVLRDIILEHENSEIHLRDLPGGLNHLFFMRQELSPGVMAGLGMINRLTNFTAPEKKRARAMAQHASAQLEKALLLRDKLTQEKLAHELQIAADIQNHLLPQRIPHVPGLDIAGRSLQARQVGGDFFDFFERPEGPFGFAVGDVAGKGVPSALLMAMTSVLMHSRNNLRGAVSPGDILDAVNQDLYDYYTQVGRFTTAFVGHYDYDTASLIFANAGHSPVIYCPHDGPARLLEADSMPLGILPDNLFCDQSIQFLEGDILLVATDGFSEATNHAQEMFGYDRLITLTKSVSERSASEILDILFQAIERFSIGHPQDDDQTLVVIKRVPQP
ncbi:MAG: PP2C family protein-serine/threonine phosphatase [Anaerolineae bacterium]